MRRKKKNIKKKKKKKKLRLNSEVNKSKHTKPMMFARFVFVLGCCCLFVKETLGNTALTSSWTPLEYGECTAPGIAEAVGYPGDGNTCNFGNSANYMPSLYQS